MRHRIGRPRFMQSFAAGGADTPFSTGIPEAPTDGEYYGRQNSAWVEVAEEAPKDGTLYGRKNNAWQPITGGGGGVPEAPTDGQIYGRRGVDASWQVVTGGAGSYLPITGGTLSGDLIVNKATPAVILNKTANTAQLNNVAGQMNGVARWQLNLGDATTEAVGNVGSNFSIQRFANSGTLIDTPVLISRSGGGMTLSGDLAIVKGSPQFSLRKSSGVAGQSNSINGLVNNFPRWILKLGDGVSESGADAGSNFTVEYTSDAGDPYTAFTFKRSDGLGIVKGDPTDALGIATKQYVDSKVGGGLDQATADTRYVNVTGDTMSGDLKISAANSALTIETTDTWGGTSKLKFDQPGYGNIASLEVNGVDSGVPAFRLGSSALAPTAVSLFTGGVDRLTVGATGGVTITGNLQINAAVDHAVLLLNKKGSGFVNAINGLTNGSLRWNIQIGSAGAETGSNAGSDLEIRRFADNGAVIDIPLSISRATATATFRGYLVVEKDVPIVMINKTNATAGAYVQGQSNGKARWNMALGDGSAETGGNAGSDFLLTPIVDSGATGTGVEALRISRATGNATFGKGVTTYGDILIAGSPDGTFVVRKNSPTNVSQIYVQDLTKVYWLWRLADGTTNDFVIHRFNDAGAIVDQPIQIKWATGNTWLGGDLLLSKNDPAIRLRRTANTGGYIVSETAAGSPRWTMAMGDSVAESGGNGGSDFSLLRFNDSGGLIGSVLGIRRSDGDVQIINYLRLGLGFLSPIDSPQGTKPGIGNTLKGWTYMYNPTYGPEMYWNADSYGRVYFGQNVDGVLVYWTRSAVVVGSVNVTATSTTYATSSDANLKEDLKSFDAGKIIDNTEVYDFAWKSTGERSYGVLAQQAIEVYPTAVIHSEKDEKAERDEWWGIDYSKYVPVLLQEMKALRERVRMLEGGVAAKPVKRKR